MFDVAIVGGGPAGATCAAFCAEGGLKTILLEREVFPREKVCGDCLNPSCWPILRKLEVAERLRTLPHCVLDRVEFVSIGNRRLTLRLPHGNDPEITVKRSLLDHLILKRASELGAEVRDNTVVMAITKQGAGKESWKLTTSRETLDCHVLVAADGRNSTIAHLCGLRAPAAKERIALQTHLPLPNEFGNRVVLQFLPDGYSGQAPVGNEELNLCLVSVPRKMRGLRSWAEKQFDIAPNHSWRT